jgi:transcriptional regulator with XRE-family HTH domain
MTDKARISLDEWESDIGDAVRQLRIDRDLSQAQLAERANLSRSAVADLENGRGTRLATLLAVLRTLERTDVFDAVMPPKGPTPMQLLAASRGERMPQRRRRARA